MLAALNGHKRVLVRRRRASVAFRACRHRVSRAAALLLMVLSLPIGGAACPAAVAESTCNQGPAWAVPAADMPRAMSAAVLATLTRITAGEPPATILIHVQWGSMPGAAPAPGRPAPGPMIRGAVAG